MRLGYFGGSFDPPHRAHRLAASLALQRCALDRVLLAPTGHQPLKAQGAEASFADRLRMVELLCQGEAGLEASAIDGPLPGGAPNYTVDTLRRLRSSLTGSTASGSRPVEIFAIVGADAFLGMRQWRQPDELLRVAEWIVVSRPGFALDVHALELTAAQREKVHLLPGLQEPVSATELRRRLHGGQNCQDLIPEPVLEYLKSHQLYR